MVEQERENELKEKKTYVAPSLTVFGSMQALTQLMSTGQFADASAMMVMAPAG